MFKIGDKVRVKEFSIVDGKRTKHVGQIFTVNKMDHGKESDKFGSLLRFNELGPNEGYYTGTLEAYNEGVYPMLKTIGSDMKAFIAEHKSAIYMIAVMFLLDHILFQGAFRERLHGLMNKFLGKVESQIDGKNPVTLVPEVKP